MTEEQDTEFRKKVLALIHTPRLEHYSECAQFVLRYLGAWTANGQIVKHLNAEYLEIIEGLWDELCKDNPEAQVVTFGLVAAGWLNTGARPCSPCVQKTPPS